MVNLLRWEAFVSNPASLGTWWPGRVDRGLAGETGASFIDKSFTLPLESHLCCWEFNSLGKWQLIPGRIRSFYYAVD